MKPHRSNQNAAGRAAAARWLGAIACLCIGLGSGYAFLLSLSNWWGRTSTIAYGLLSLGAFIAAALIGRRAALTPP